MLDVNAYAIANIMCARCEARPGSPCVSVTGLRAPRPHSSRTNPVIDGIRDGLAQAYRELADRAARARDNDGETLEEFADAVGRIAGLFER